MNATDRSAATQKITVNGIPGNAQPPLSRPVLFLIAALGAACSMLLSGFVLGVDNNAFHLPIVASLFDEPQYRGDNFMQSLRYFASGVWLVLRGSARIFDPYWLFLALLYVSRLLSFLGLLLCASLLGVNSARRALVFAIVVCFTPLLQGESAAGDGGLFVNYFTHSEIANGTILLAFYFAMRARLDLALAMLGATFFINVFMAAWICAPLAAIAATHLGTPAGEPRRLIKQLAAGGAIFCLCAAPVLHNIVSNPDFGRPLTFDYTQFNIFHYPYHCLPGFAPWREYAELLCVALLALACLVELGPAAAQLRYAYAGVVAVYLAGLVAPSLSSAPLVLNLSLLRSGVLFYLLAALAAAAVCARWLFGTEQSSARLFAPLLIVVLCMDRLWLPAALACIVLKWAWSARAWNVPVPRLDWAALAVLVLLVWPRDFMHQWRENSYQVGYAAEMGRIGDWARQHTPSDAVFLMPTELQRKGPRRHVETYVKMNRAIVDAQGAFVYHSHRRLRGSFKEGAAMMWAPSFYDEWRRDIDATLKLMGVAEKTAYARSHGISYVLASCEETGGAAFVPVTHTRHFCVFASD